MCLRTLRRELNGRSDVSFSPKKETARRGQEHLVESAHSA